MSSFVPTAITWPFFELETWDFALRFILMMMMMSTTTTKKNHFFFNKKMFFDPPKKLYISCGVGGVCYQMELAITSYVYLYLISLELVCIRVSMMYWLRFSVILFQETSPLLCGLVWLSKVVSWNETSVNYTYLQWWIHFI